MLNVKKEEENLTDQEPFKLKWLDSAYQQTLLPNAPWHLMEDKISLVLAQRVEKQFLKPERKEALLQILGQDFVDKYLPTAKHNPWVLESPAMTSEDKQKMLRDAQAYLNSQMIKAANDVGYQCLTARTPVDNPPSDYSTFLQHTFNIFKVGLDRELYQKQQQQLELTKQKKHQFNTQKKYLQKKIPVPSRMKPVFSGMSSSTGGSSQKPNTGTIRELAQTVQGDPPPLWGPQSDEMGQSILAILQRDPHKFEHVAERLHGRQLPGSLRAYMWSDVLFKDERRRLKEVVVEKVVRERFAKAVARGIQDLKISRATNSPINGLIENAVIEIYNKTTSLVPFKTPEHMKETIRILNVIYVYDRSYEPYLIYWLFPLQIAFQSLNTDVKDDKGENIIELAMYLDLLNSNCFPNWPTVYAIAECALADIRQADPDFYNHLKMISRLNANPKEFLVQLIHQEKAKAERLLQSPPKSVTEEEISAQLLSDPIVFVRRWIGEGFVSILDAPSVMYIWDQCFLQSWRSTVIEHFCVALLEMLRQKFMAARDYMEMKQVFLNEPCKLYTIDLQQAWIHLERGNDPAEIPFFNRQRPVTAYSRLSPASFYAGDNADNVLGPCGIKGFKLHLVIPSVIMQREPWLANVDPNSLKLSVVAYFGEVNLQSHQSTMPSTVVSTTQDSYGNTVYEIVYPEDKFVFRDIDLAPYDIEREMGAYPYSIIRVEYHLPGPSNKNKPPISVGWARIPLFQRHHVPGAVSDASLDAIWDLQAGVHTYDLHPGEIPESLIATQPVIPAEDGKIEEGTVLGYNSKLTAIIYDPNNENMGKLDPSMYKQIPPNDTREPSPALVTLRKPTPVPSLPPTPAPAANPVREEPWVPHKKEATKVNPKPTGLKDPFDLYIDGIRFIPDNASVIKVTGRVLRTGSVNNVEDILALPDLNSSARCPKFNSRIILNIDKKEADPGMLVFLRVYTVDVVTETISIIGSCLVPFFSSTRKLHVGGFQYRLHNGMPVFSSTAGLAGILASDFNTVPVMPTSSILVRVMPHTDTPIPCPQYQSGYYESESCKPNTSEMRIFKSYTEHMSYPDTVRQMIQRIMETEGLPPHGMSDAELLDWLQSRLDIRRHLPLGQPAENLSLMRCVRYKLKTGLNVQIKQIFGMPESIYIQAFARVSPGDKVLSLTPTADGYGKEEKFITLKHNFDSFQSCQEWTDDVVNLHPFYDQYSCLVIQLFGLEVKYHPKPAHKEAGTVTDVNNRELSLEDTDRILGWTVVPLFEGNSVLVGTHHVPVFKGKPSAEILQQLTMLPVQQVLQQQPWTSRTKYSSASMKVILWDAHFEFDEIPELPFSEHLLETVGNVEDYHKAMKPPTKGKTMNNFVLDVLEPKFQKQGTMGALFQRERLFFKDLMEKTFYNLLENALMTAGYGPL